LHHRKIIAVGGLAARLLAGIAAGAGPLSEMKRSAAQTKFHSKNAVPRHNGGAGVRRDRRRQAAGVGAADVGPSLSLSTYASSPLRGLPGLIFPMRDPIRLPVFGDPRLIVPSRARCAPEVLQRWQSC